MKEMTLEATIDNIPKVTAFIDEQLEQLDCPMRAQTQIDIAIDEIFSNISYYAYAPEVGNATVRIESESDSNMVVLTFIDEGAKYDPLTTETPDIDLPAEQRKIGGLGVFIVKKTMDGVSYEYIDGHNVLKIKKKIQ